MRDLLPMAPDACSLDEEAMAAQFARYRAIGRGASLVALEPRRVSVRVREQVPDHLVRRLVAVEQACCPFFRLTWLPECRELTVAVTADGYEPALETITYALGI